MNRDLVNGGVFFAALEVGFQNPPRTALSTEDSDLARLVTALSRKWRKNRAKTVSAAASPSLHECPGE